MRVLGFLPVPINGDKNPSAGRDGITAALADKKSVRFSLISGQKQLFQTLGM